MRRLPVLVIAALMLAVGSSGCAGFPPGGRNGGFEVSPPDPGTGQGGGTGGGVVIGGSGTGGGASGPGNPVGGGGATPITGQKPSLETPVPGQLRPAAVNVWAMTPNVVGAHLTVLLEWWSGPPPCSVLDSVRVARDGRAITMTPMEGSDAATQGRVACPAIAMLHGTVVDLGIMPAGTYTLASHGDLAPIEITIR